MRNIFLSTYNFDNVKIKRESYNHEYIADPKIAYYDNTVKLGDKEHFDNEQIGVKEPFPVTNCQLLHKCR